MSGNIYQAFIASAQQHGDRLAVWDGDQKVTYGELVERSQRVGRALMAAGVKKGDPVGIWAVNRLEWVEAGLGVQAAGGVIIPLGTRLRGPEVASILARAGAKALFCDDRFGDYSFPGSLAKHALPALENIVVFGDPAKAAPPADARPAAPVTPFAQFLDRAEQVAPAELAARTAGVTSEDVVDMLFTSGTTGQPKGVPMTHSQSLVACEIQQLDISNFVPGDVFAVIFPFAHNAGYRAGWQVSLLNGVTVVPVRTYDVLEILQLIQKVKATYFPAPPTIFRGMLDEPRLVEFDLSSIRNAQTGGTDVPVQLIRDMRERLGVQNVTTGYGLTECAGSVTSCRPGDPDEVVARTAGSVLSNLEVRILDADDQPLPVGAQGQIAVRGPQVLHGYLNDPEANRKSFTPDGFFLTGDVGVFDADGNLTITDRLKDMYLTGGFNCYPAEIESVLRKLDGVADVAVVGVPDSRLGEVGRAFIVRRPGAELTEAQVIAWCREEMANYKVPRAIVFLEALPRNTMGKVLKAELRQKTSAAVGAAAVG